MCFLTEPYWKGLERITARADDGSGWGHTGSRSEKLTERQELNIHLSER